MTKFNRHLIGLALLTTTAFAAAPALAQDAPATPAPPAAAPAAPLATPFAAPALAEDALGAIAGREDTNQTALANLNAGVSHNSVGANSTTGDAKISDNAFQNLAGLSILNVNTGNNVAINAAMNVTISINPGQ